MPVDRIRARVLASSEESQILKIGITGHQKREGADWVWVEETLACIIAKCEPSIEGWTSLAAGADQSFAQAVLDHRGSLVAVIPIAGYERFFEHSEEIERYRRLRDASKRVIQLDNPDPQRAFFRAGELIVEECSSLIAVWDGEPSKGLGGTADIVGYARSLGRSLLVLNPITKSVEGGLG